jgi:hypothetical protein
MDDKSFVDIFQKYWDFHNEVNNDIIDPLLDKKDFSF